METLNSQICIAWDIRLKLKLVKFHDPSSQCHNENSALYYDEILIENSSLPLPYADVCIMIGTPSRWASTCKFCITKSWESGCNSSNKEWYSKSWSCLFSSNSSNKNIYSSANSCSYTWTRKCIELPLIDIYLFLERLMYKFQIASY